MTAMPSAIGFSSSITEGDFSTAPLANNGEGTGVLYPFSGALTTVRTNGSPLDNIYTIPFYAPGLIDPTAYSGFVDTAVSPTVVSGFLIHPRFLVERLRRESTNWTKYRFRWLKILYKPFVGTNFYGAFTIGYSSDPTALIESNNLGTQPSYNDITEVVPNMTTSVFTPGEMLIKRFPPEYKNTNALPTGVLSASTGDISYLNEFMSGRIGAVYSGQNQDIYFGQLWVEGQVEFRGPKSNNVLIGSVDVPDLDAKRRSFTRCFDLREHKWSYITQNITPRTSPSIPVQKRTKKKEGKTAEIISKPSIAFPPISTEWDDEDSSPC